MTVASIAGGTVSSLANRSTDSIQRKLCEGLIGALVGVFVGPAIADEAGVVQSNFRMAIGFGCGAGGYILLTFFMDWLKSGSWTAWLSRYKPMTGDKGEQGERGEQGRRGEPGE